MLRKLALIAGLFLLPCTAMAEQVIQQSTTAQNILAGPVVQSIDHSTAETALTTTAVITATGGSTTTITTATSQIAGQKVVWGAATTTTALRGLAYTISSVSGSGPYTLTMPTMAASPVSGDTYVVYNFATGGSSTTVTSAQSATVGQWLTFPATTATGSLQGVSAWVTAVSGAGPYTLTVGSTLPATPTSSDFFGLSQIIVSISKNAGAFGVPVGALSETGSGYYALAGNATDSSTLGRTLVHWSVTGPIAGDSNETPLMIVAYNPLSGTNLGLSALPTANPAASNGLLTVGTGSGQLNPSGGVLPGLTTALTGTATAGGASTITLAAGPAVDDQIKGDYVAITSGTGSQQARTITAYNHTTLVATVSRSWAVNPDATSVYAVIMNPHPALDANLAVTTGTNSDKSGYSLTQAFPPNFSSTSIDGSGRVLLQPTQAGVTIPTVTAVSGSVASVTGAVGSVTGNVGGNVVGSVASVAGSVGSVTGNVGGSVASVVGAVGSVTGAVGSVTGNVGGISGITFPSNFGTFAVDGSGRVTLTPTTISAIYAHAPDGSLSMDDVMTILLANVAGTSTNSWNAGTHTLTTTYKRQDGTTTAVVTTTIYQSGSTQPPVASRSTTNGTLP